MKNIIFTSLAAVFFSFGIFSQSINNVSKLSDDEKARVKFSLHLITYNNPPSFESANGRAYYNVVNASFEENLIIPEMTMNAITDNDKEIILKHIELLNGSIQAPLTWEHLLQLEAQYQTWLDRTTHKTSIYKK